MAAAGGLVAVIVYLGVSGAHPLAVSAVADFATGPFSIQYFNRVAVYGVFANLSADFLAGVVMMPALAIGGQAVALKPGKRTYAIQLWAQAHRLALPADADAAQARAFD